MIASLVWIWELPGPGRSIYSSSHTTNTHHIQLHITTQELPHIHDIMHTTTHTDFNSFNYHDLSFGIPYEQSMVNYFSESHPGLPVADSTTTKLTLNNFQSRPSVSKSVQSTPVLQSTPGSMYVAIKYVSCCNFFLLLSFSL